MQFIKADRQIICERNSTNRIPALNIIAMYRCPDRATQVCGKQELVLPAGLSEKRKDLYIGGTQSTGK